MAGNRQGRILVAATQSDWPERLAVPLGGIEISLVKSGADALRTCREDPPDLLVAEMALPDMTGIGLCRGLREEPETRRVPLRRGGSSPAGTAPA